MTTFRGFETVCSKYWITFPWIFCTDEGTPQCWHIGNGRSEWYFGKQGFFVRKWRREKVYIRENLAASGLSRMGDPVYVQ